MKKTIDKGVIRKKILELRKGMTPIAVRAKSKKIIDLLFSTPEFNKARSIFTYLSFDNEVMTDKIVKSAKKIYVPSVSGDNICICNYSDKLKKNMYGIHEPEEIIEPKDEIDIAIVPGVAFDKNLNRIGFGKAFYDKLLKDKHMIKIGLCFDFQIVDNIPKENHDIPMDIVITEQRIIRLSDIQE